MTTKMHWLKNYFDISYVCIADLGSYHLIHLKLNTSLFLHEKKNILKKIIAIS